MLKSRDNMLKTVSRSSEGIAAPDVETRVKTDEFTSAINRIEARRARESAQANGTVDVEQTIRDLHIDASSEEVLREIAAIRTEAVDSERLVQVAAAEKLLAKQTRRKRIGRRIAIGFGLVMFGAVCQYGKDHDNNGSINDNESISDSGGTARTVAALGDHQEIFLSSDALQSLISSGGTTSSAQASTITGSTSSNDDDSWPVIRVGKSLSLYGYIDSTTVENSSPSKVVHVSSDDSRTLVAVPLAGVNTLSSDDDEITLANLPPQLSATPPKS